MPLLFLTLTFYMIDILIEIHCDQYHFTHEDIYANCELSQSFLHGKFHYIKLEFLLMVAIYRNFLQSINRWNYLSCESENISLFNLIIADDGSNWSRNVRNSTIKLQVLH